MWDARATMQRTQRWWCAPTAILALFSAVPIATAQSQDGSGLAALGALNGAAAVERFASCRCADGEYTEYVTSSSSSGSSSSSSGGTTTGQVTFWTQTDLGCGNISVSISGSGSQTISGYYSSVSSCGLSSNATFTLNISNHIKIFLP